MNKRIRINNTLYEAVDLRLKPPKYRDIRNGEELFYDEAVGAIRTLRNRESGYDSRSIHFSRVISDNLVANFVNIWIELPDHPDKNNLFRGIEVSLDGKDYDLNDTNYDISDHDLQVIFDNIIRDIYYKMELSDENVFVDTVKVSARRAVSKYGLVKQ